ncbi:hypothetical protein TNCV_2804621 [Trichonephila clavipes]|nr:hypothetical protein TNCV_2804621 [Trichonephila clavipes]
MGRFLRRFVYERNRTKSVLFLNIIEFLMCQWLRFPSGYGHELVAGVSSPGATEDPPCRGAQCTLNLLRLSVYWDSRRGFYQLRYRLRHLTEVQNDAVRRE